MKFKTRLVITFLTIILLPLVLASTAFLCIGAYLSREQEEYGIRTQDYNILIDPTQASKSISDEIFFEVKEILDTFGTAGIMIGADCTIQGRDIHLEHIRTAVRAAHNYK